ncbi:MAG: class I SAM-dependent methyltransferase, partial [Mesorhizobium sp.]
ILEIGAGDGSFMLAVARRMAGHWPGVDLVMLDRIDLITTQLRGDFDRLGWPVEAVTADVFDWARNNEGT